MNGQQLISKRLPSAACISQPSSKLYRTEGSLGILVLLLLLFVVESHKLPVVLITGSRAPTAVPAVHSSTGTGTGTVLVPGVESVDYQYYYGTGNS